METNPIETNPIETNPITELTNLAKRTAKYSFLIGTTIFLIYCVSRIDDLIYLGVIYLTFALMVNLLMFLILITAIIAYPKQYYELLKTSAIILLNLPIAALYFWVVTEIPVY